jgi:hypothetical protein
MSLNDPMPVKTLFDALRETDSLPCVFVWGDARWEVTEADPEGAWSFHGPDVPVGEDWTRANLARDLWVKFARCLSRDKTSACQALLSKGTSL